MNNSDSPSGAVAVSGASGYVGRRLCEFLARRKVPVLALVRREDAFLSNLGPVEQVRCPAIESTNFVDTPLSNVRVFVHAAAHVHHADETSREVREMFNKVNVHGTEHAARLARKAGAEAFLQLSTVSVYGNAAGSTPFAYNSPTAPDTIYASSKLEAEAIAMEIFSDSVYGAKILRFPMVYGPGAPGNWARLEKLVATGIPLPFAACDAKRSFVHIRNLVAAIHAISEDPNMCPEIALMSDGVDLSTRELIELLATASGSKGRVFWMPPRLMEFALSVAGQRRAFVSLFEPFQIDSSHFFESMGWQPPHTPVSAMTTEEADPAKPTNA